MCFHDNKVSFSCWGGGLGGRWWHREWASSGSSEHPGWRAEQVNVSGREASSTRLQAQGVCQARTSLGSTLVSFSGPVCRHHSQLSVDEASWPRPALPWPFLRPPGHGGHRPGPGEGQIWPQIPALSPAWLPTQLPPWVPAPLPVCSGKVRGILL